MDNNRKILIGAYCLSGPATVHKLWERTKGDMAMLSLVDLSGLSLSNKFKDALNNNSFKAVGEEELKTALNYGVQILTICEKDHPANIMGDKNIPPVLYIRGNLKQVDLNGIAVVGTRNLDDYGARVTAMVSRKYSLIGKTIISGLAVGADTVAHKTALENGGRTIAVMGTGIDIIFPAENRKLADDIVSNGAVITQFPMGTEGVRKNFPIRNKTVVSLSERVVITRAPIKSGAMITAELALKAGKILEAVPGDITNSLSAGPNSMIAIGAKVFSESPQISVVSIPDPDTVLSNDLERELYRHLRGNSLHPDSLVAKTNKGINVILASLLNMELKGIIVKEPGNIYKLR